MITYKRGREQTIKKQLDHHHNGPKEVLFLTRCQLFEIDTSRPNVKVESNVLVNRVLFDGVRAIGVEFVDGRGVSHRRFAESEVILSGGAINSPQLLMLSGIGDADHLKGLDIPVGKFYSNPNHLKSYQLC